MPKSDPKRTGPKRSHIANAMIDMVDGFYENGLISKTTMRSFEASAAAPVPEMSAAVIKSIRAQAAVSQPVFAHYLNVSRNLVSEWERGTKRPGGPALRLLSLVQRKGLDAIT